MQIAGKTVSLAASFTINEIIHFNHYAFFKIKQNSKNIIQTYNMLFYEEHFPDQELENMSWQKFTLDKLSEMRALRCLYKRN